MAEVLILRSSSSRREAKPEKKKEQQQAKKIGCMSGIFHLLHSHHLSPKRLTSLSGPKEKTVNSPKNSKPPVSGPTEDPPASPDHRRLSCNVPRSPTLPPEIRRSNAVNSPESIRRPPALVARLMGLEEIPPPSPESSTEKRRKLLGALEKCDEDLKALKKIIEAVSVAEDRRNLCAVTPREPSADSVAVTRDRREFLHEYVLGSRFKGRAAVGARENGSRDLDGGDLMMEEKRCSDVNGEQPSPVSVLDEISSSPSEKESDTPEKGGGRYKVKDDMNGCFFHRATVDSFQGFYKEKGGEDPMEKMSSMMKMTKRRSGSTASKSMVDTVNEVWKDGIWEEKWEIGKLGVELEGDIFGDLVDEIVRELGYYFKSSLPLKICRKRLYF